MIGYLKLEGSAKQVLVKINRFRKLFVNLAVDDLARSIEFFEKLGVPFHPPYTNETMGCMIVGDSFVMLLPDRRFEDYARKPISDASRMTEGIYSIEVATRSEVDELVDKALAFGATRAAEPRDDGYYCRSFYDLDGHHWEAFYLYTDR